MNQNLWVLAEACCGDWHWSFSTTFVPRFGVLVPDHPSAIASSSHKSVIKFVERDAIYGPNEWVLALFLFTMTLEAEILRINRIWLLKVDSDNSNSTLNGTNCIAATLTKASDGTSGVPQGALGKVNRVEIVLLHSSQIPNVNLFVRMRSNHQGIRAWKLVHWFSHIGLTNLIELDALLSIDLVEFNHRIPTSRD